MSTTNYNVKLVLGMSLVMWPIASIVRGLVISYLWGVFATPVFDVPTPALPYILGLSVLIGLFHGPQDYDAQQQRDQTTADVLGKLIATSLLYPLLALVFGWVYSLFI